MQPETRREEEERIKNGMRAVHAEGRGRREERELIKRNNVCVSPVPEGGRSAAECAVGLLLYTRNSPTLLGNKGTKREPFHRE